mgnify:CR=1 FL=1
MLPSRASNADNTGTLHPKSARSNWNEQIFFSQGKFSISTSWGRVYILPASYNYLSQSAIVMEEQKSSPWNILWKLSSQKSIS